MDQVSHQRLHVGVLHALAGTLTEVVQQYMDRNDRSKGAAMVKKVCGVLVLVAGLCLIHRA